MRGEIGEETSAGWAVERCCLRRHPRCASWPNCAGTDCSHGSRPPGIWRTASTTCQSCRRRCAVRCTPTHGCTYPAYTARNNSLLWSVARYHHHGSSWQAASSSRGQRRGAWPARTRGHRPGRAGQSQRGDPPARTMWCAGQQEPSARTGWHHGLPTSAQHPSPPNHVGVGDRVRCHIEQRASPVRRGTAPLMLAEREQEQQRCRPRCGCACCHTFIGELQR